MKDIETQQPVTDESSTVDKPRKPYTPPQVFALEETGPDGKTIYNNDELTGLFGPAS